MKIRIHFLILIFIIALISSCTKDQNDAVELDNLDQVEERHTYSRVNPIYDPCKAINIEVFIHECFEGTVFYDAILAAIENYNALGIGVHYTIIDDPAQAQNDYLRFECNNDENCSGGGASTKVGHRRVGLNTSITWEECCPQAQSETIDLCSATFIAMHEMMHSLGFGHTDDFSAQHIPGTLLTDPESILNSGPSFNPCELPCEFSEGDLEALELIYPPCVCPEDRNCPCTKPSPDEVSCPELIYDALDYLECNMDKFFEESTEESTGDFESAICDFTEALNACLELNLECPGQQDCNFAGGLPCAQHIIGTYERFLCKKNIYLANPTNVGRLNVLNSLCDFLTTLNICKGTNFSC